MRRRIISIALLLALVLAFVPGGFALANIDVSVEIDGVPVVFADQTPVTIDGRTLVPVRGVFEHLGFAVGWDDVTQTAILVRNDYVVMIPVGSNTFTTNGVSHSLDVPARLIGGGTMLPIRLPLESVGYHVDWDENTQTVIVTSTAPPPPPPTVPGGYTAPFTGRIAIVTNALEQWEEEYRSAQALVRRYGADRVIHRTWPVMFAIEPDLMRSLLVELASDPEVGAIIINQAVVNTAAAIDAVRAIRGDDIFIVVASAAEDPRDISARVDLALDINFRAVGEAFVAQAISMGAEAIVHISFPRHMAVPMLASRRDAMSEAARAAGIPFYDLGSPDPMEEGGMSASQLYITQSVPRWVEEFGVNTAFFSTNCGQQIPLLQQVLATGAIYVQPCCPSPFHAFPQAFGIQSHVGTGRYDAAGREIMQLRDVTEVIVETSRVIDAAGRHGRIANWLLPPPFVWTTVGFYYAVEWLNGDLIQNPGDAPDMELIQRLFGDYTESIFGKRIYMEIENLRFDTVAFPMFVVGILPYLVY